MRLMGRETGFEAECNTPEDPASGERPWDYADITE